MKHLATFPDFLGIGAMKAGTTWLHKNLRSHPEIWMPPVKELKYFNELESGQPTGWRGILLGRGLRHATHRKQLSELLADCFRQPKTLLKPVKRSVVWWKLKFYLGQRSDHWYCSLFDPDKSKVRGEISPTYATLKVPTRRHLQSLRPDLKIIYIVRNPIERAWSAQEMMTAKRQALSFVERKTDSADRSDYVSTLENWREFFPDRQIFIGYLEDIYLYPDEFLNSVFRFLNVRPRGPVTKKRVNSYGGDTIPTQVAREFAIRDYEMMSHQVRSLGAYSSFWKFTADQLIAREDLPAQLAYPFFQGNLWNSWCADHTPPGFSSGCLADRHDSDRLAG